MSEIDNDGLFDAIRRRRAGIPEPTPPTTPAAFSPTAARCSLCGRQCAVEAARWWRWWRWWRGSWRAARGAERALWIILTVTGWAPFMYVRQGPQRAESACCGWSLLRPNARVLPDRHRAPVRRAALPPLGAPRARPQGAPGHTVRMRGAALALALAACEPLPGAGAPWPPGERWGGPLELHAAPDLAPALTRAAATWTTLGAPPITVIADPGAAFAGREPTGESTATLQHPGADAGWYGGTFTFATGEDAGEITEAHVVVNGDVPLGDAAPTPDGRSASILDTEALLAHEVGHALGLDHLAGCPDGTMRPAIGPDDTSARTPEACDAAALARLYGDSQ